MYNYSYPSDITSSDVYVTIVGLQNNGFTTTELRSIDDKFKNFETYTTGIMALPVPNDLKEELQVQYQNIADSSLLETGAKALLNKTGLVGKATGLLSSVKSTGAINQSQMVFDSVNTKTWTWTWTLIPESKIDANNIINIIKQLRLMALPSLAKTAHLMNFPDIVKVKFKGKIPNLIRFLPAYITSVSFDTGDFFQLYNDGNFPEINLTVGFTEIASRIRDIESKLY